MKSLLVLRHAKSSWNNPALSDHERPLNKRGREAAPRMGQLIVDKSLIPDVILCSTATRARETTELLLQVPGFETNVEYLDELYHAPPKSYYQALTAVDSNCETAMVVGHNPGLEDLVDELTGNCVTMPTAALAHIEVAGFDSLVSEPTGRLASHWIPRELD